MRIKGKNINIGIKKAVNNVSFNSFLLLEEIGLKRKEKQNCKFKLVWKSQNRKFVVK